MTLSSMTPSLTIAGLETIAERYDIILCDVWGVLHNGVVAFPEAGEALARFRAKGGTVILLTNAPRPHNTVRSLLERLQASPEAYDAIVTSGDVTRSEIALRKDQPVWHLGPERDLPIFEGYDIDFSTPEEAAYVVCTGLFDDNCETPDDYIERLSAIAKRQLTMICANPDLVVERGNDLLYCAGALAAVYEKMGGRTIYAGKPHAPIYARALEQATAIRTSSPQTSRVLAIGDALHTDIAGAQKAGFDSLMVARGIHASDLLSAQGELDEERLVAWLCNQSVRPTMAIERLVW